MYFTMTAENQPKLCTIKISCVSTGDEPDGVTLVRIKRKKSGAMSFVTLKEVPIVTKADFTFEYIDKTGRAGVTYDYHVIPVKGGTEQLAQIATVNSAFDSYFLSDSTGDWVCDLNPTFNPTINTSVAYVKPIIGKYPKRVSNGDTQYITGEVSGLFLPKDSNGCYNDIESILSGAFAHRRELLKFLCNGKPKLFKTYEGDVLYVGIDANPQEVPSKFFGATEVKFGVTEIAAPPEE